MNDRFFTTDYGERFHRVDRPHLGLMAGWGEFPLSVARSLRANGYRVHCAALKGHADPRLADHCDSFKWVGLLQFGRAIRHFRSHGVRDAVMAGKVHKVQLLHPWRWLKLMPDLRTLFALPRVLARDSRDDTLLNFVVSEFARDGIRYLPATDFAPELLVKAGQLTRRGPTSGEWRDIEFGWSMAKAMGKLDVGQSVCVCDRTVLAVEAIEGTDHCIQRAGILCRKGGFTVVKTAKPQQDMRFDVPTVGVGTLETLVAAGGRILAIEAEKTIVLNQAAFVEYANRKKLVVVALSADAVDVPINVA